MELNLTIPVPIGKMFNVSPETISGIKHGRKWKHVNITDGDKVNEGVLL